MSLGNTKLEKASRLALIGTILLALTSLIGTILSLIQLDSIILEQYKTGQEAGMTLEQFKTVMWIGFGVGIVVLVIIILLFLFFSLRIKKAKSKAIAITLIVLSGILLLLTLQGITGNIIGVVINAISYGFILAGGITAIQAPDSEYEMNRI